MKFYNKVVKFVNSSFANSPHKDDIKHFKNTVFWVKKLKPDADEAILIAAYGHDMERSERKERGAWLVCNYLKQIGVSKETQDNVYKLISKHEVGGTRDQNLLKDADSISFFDKQPQKFIDKYLPKLGYKKVKAKFDWMFNRISSVTAQQIAKNKYLRAIKLLETKGSNGFDNAK